MSKLKNRPRIHNKKHIFVRRRTLKMLLNNIDKFFKANISFTDLESNYELIEFSPPNIQYDFLHPDTKSKFEKIYSFPLKKGIYGPFYRYHINENKLKADNDLGGYFTDLKSGCIKCIKSSLWLFDKNRKYFYRDKELYRHICYFRIDNDEFSTIFIGKVAFGKAIQIRPNNWIFRKDKGNGIYFKLDKKIEKKSCKKCQKKCLFEEY